MSLFNVSIKEKLKRDKNDFLDSLYTKILDNKEYESTKEKTTFKVEKCKLSTILRFNTKVTIESNEIIAEAELHDTIFLTIFIVLAILFTYGIGVILIVAFAYLQKRKANIYLQDLISKTNFKND